MSGEDLIGIRPEQRQRAIDSVQQYFGPTESAETIAADIVDMVCRIFGVVGGEQHGGTDG